MDAFRSQAGQLPWLTGLRGLAALYVVCSHAWYHIWPAVPPPYGYGKFPPDAVAAWTGWLYYGHFAVVVFIVLSGFCLMLRVVRHGAQPEGAAAFLKRRAWRILPPYYAALVLSLLLAAQVIGQPTGTQWDIALPITTQGVVTHVLLLNDLFDATQINYVFWSIALEVHLYLLFPSLVVAWKRWGAAATTGASCAVVYGIVLLLHAMGVSDVPPQFVGLCACFVIGMATAFVAFDSSPEVSRWRRHVPWGACASGLLAAVIALCGWWGHVVAEQRFAVLDALCAAGVACWMVAACGPQGAGRTRRWLEGRAIVGVGRFSYSLYLTHAPVLQCVWLYGVRPWFHDECSQFVALALWGVPAALVVAGIFFIVAERPFLSGRNDGERGWGPLVRGP